MNCCEAPLEHGKEFSLETLANAVVAGKVNNVGGGGEFEDPAIGGSRGVCCCELLLLLLLLYKWSGTTCEFRRESEAPANEYFDRECDAADRGSSLSEAEDRPPSIELVRDLYPLMLLVAENFLLYGVFP